MGPHIISSLTSEEASRICMKECMALCCRGPLILPLTDTEIYTFREHADKLQVEVSITMGSTGGWVKFSDHPRDLCPMLDQDTFACRIYKYRPQRCRDFPDKLTPGCAISGG